MDVALVYDPVMATYRFPTGHPMRPERFTLAVSLMRAWGLVGEGGVPGVAGEPRAAWWHPHPATDEDLLLAHTPGLIAAAKAAGSAVGADPWTDFGHGIGPGDTPAFRGMHEASALAVGGTMLALAGVLDERARRAFNPAGGLHHAQRDSAEGFCVYNDAVVAIERATLNYPGLRVAYVDVDAHHGDGVERAFAQRSDVLTVSVHESGRYLFPGTGASRDIGEGLGTGYAVNVPLPPDAGPECYALAVGEVVAPALRAFVPDVVVAQLGADNHRQDPLAHLAQTVQGHIATTRQIVELADELCEGRIVALGGGGYEPFTVVPRMWAGALAVLLGREVPSSLPAEWLVEAARAAGIEDLGVHETFDERMVPPSAEVTAEALRLTERAIAETLAASPLLGGVR